MTHTPSSSPSPDDQTREQEQRDAYDQWINRVFQQGHTPDASPEQHAAQPDPAAPSAPDASRLTISIDLGGIVGAATQPSLAARTNHAVVRFTNPRVSPLYPMTDYRLFIPGHQEHLHGRAYLHAPMDSLRRYALQLWRLYDDVEMRYSLYALPDLALASIAQQVGAVEFGQRYSDRLIDVSAAPTVARALATYRAHAEVSEFAPLNLILMRLPVGEARTRENTYAVDGMIAYATDLLRNSYQTPDHNSNPLS